MRGRRSKFKIPKEKVRQFVLDNILNPDGSKKSIRQFFKSQEFIDYTGMKGDNGKPISDGTVNYWIVELDLYESSIYDYHYNITKRIPVDVELKDWTRKNNRNNDKEKDKRFVLEQYDEVKLKRVIKRICKEIDSPVQPSKYSNYISIWKYLTKNKYFVDDENKLIKLFKKYYNEL